MGRPSEIDSRIIPRVSTKSRKFRKSLAKVPNSNYEGDTSGNDDLEDGVTQPPETHNSRRYDRRSSSQVTYQEAESSADEVNGSADEEEQQNMEEEKDIEGEIEDYLYLIGTQHYDDEDDKLYETISVVEEGDNIVGYRKIANSISTSTNKIGNKKDKVDGPIHIRDIQNMTKDYDNQQKQQKRQRHDKSNKKL